MPNKQGSFVNDPGTMLRIDKRKSTLKMKSGSLEKSLDTSPDLKNMVTSPRLNGETSREKNLASVEENNLMINDGSNFEEEELLNDTPAETDKHL